VTHSSFLDFSSDTSCLIKFNCEAKFAAPVLDSDLSQSQQSKRQFTVFPCALGFTLIPGIYDM